MIPEVCPLGRWLCRPNSSASGVACGGPTASRSPDNEHSEFPWGFAPVTPPHRTPPRKREPLPPRRSHPPTHTHRSCAPHTHRRRQAKPRHQHKTANELQWYPLPRRRCVEGPLQATSTVRIPGTEVGKTFQENNLKKARRVGVGAADRTATRERATRPTRATETLAHGAKHAFGHASDLKRGSFGIVSRRALGRFGDFHPKFQPLKNPESTQPRRWGIEPGIYACS